MAKSKTGKDSAKRETRKKGNAGQVLVWLMLGMVVFGLGGYGITNFSGNINSIGSVGDQDISTADYSRALQQELAAYRQQLGAKLTAKQALAMGLDSTVRAQLITTAALDGEDQRIGLSVGNGALRDAIRAMPAFQGPDGKFDDSTYKLVLQQNGLSVSDFEAKMRRQLTQKILETATKGAVPAPKAYISTLEGYIGQNRSFSTLTVTDKDLTGALPTPTDAELKAYYDAHKADFTAPEAKMISYVSLTPEMLAGKMKVDPKQLDQVYQQNKDQFDKPEKRLVERLVYPTEAAAQAAKAELDSGKATFPDLVKARGLAMADVDMGDVTKDDLSDDAAKAVFGLDKPGIVGPVKSALGPALFRMNAIIPADSTGADEARAELAEGLRTQEARQAISNQVEDITNKLAAGATLEDLAKESDMKLAKITYTSGDKDGIAAYPAFRTAADAVKDGDYPQLIQLKDGGIAALRLDSIRKAALIPYDTVADKVKAGWAQEAKEKALKARAEAIVADLKAGKTLADFGTADQNGPMTRDGYVDGAPGDLVKDVFALTKAGDLTVVQDGENTMVVRLDSITPPDPKDPDVKKLAAQLEQSATTGIENDAYQLFATALVDGTKIKLDQQAIAAVNAQFN